MFFAPSLLGRHARYGYAPSVYLNARGFDRLFDDVSADQRVRVESDDTSVTLSLDVPGLAKEQLTIAIEGDTVRIESKADAPRSFKAAYQLAADIDAATSQATLENGVLTLKLGKLVPASKETVLAIS
jgi:HSP20 family protein